MVQTGDPSGSGKGGQSIWGAAYPDEIRSTLKVRMADAVYHHALTSLLVQWTRHSRDGQFRP